MKIILVLILLTTFKTCLTQDVREIFENINKHTGKFNAIAADIAWESSVNPGSPGLASKSAKYQKERIQWQQRTCNELIRLEKRDLLNSTQIRQKYLLCRGPQYTFKEARVISALYEELQTIYTNAEVCIPAEEIFSSNNLTGVEDAILKYLSAAEEYSRKVLHKKVSTLFAAKVAVRNEDTEKKGLCLKGEDDFQNLMAFSRNEAVLSWAWSAWREQVGPPMKEPYRKLVNIENVAARRNGYSDIGASWRDEQEVSSVRQKCKQLYERVRPLYTLIHGVMRFYLRREYGDIVPERGPIPAHLLGNLWSQNWEPLADLIIPNTIDLDESIKKLNWTVEHMVRRAEDFYQSLGLPPMTDAFWTKSVLTRDNREMRCHGAAADMFKPGDFRLIYCSGTTKEDFYVLHHELGHIQYYMAYEHQPALFKQANSAFHEAIGDAIMYGVMIPQHLQRLGLINDSLLYGASEIIKEIDDIPGENDRVLDLITDIIVDSKDHKPTNESNFHNEEFPSENIKKSSVDSVKITVDDVLMLKQAFNKIPQIPFSLLIDEYRWKYFEGDFTSLDLNKAFWEIALELQGIAPPMRRGVEYFDVGAKFHVPDNTPYIRYFLSSFLQHQLFESLCKAAVFGRRGVEDPLPETITMNRCDIYGSKTAGKLLKDIMSRGHSQHWQQVLRETTGQDDITSGALEQYYRPLLKLLKKLVRLHRIPIGW